MSTHPCGAPVLMSEGMDMIFPSFTCCFLPVRKFVTYSQMEAGAVSWISLVERIPGIKCSSPWVCTNTAGVFLMFSMWLWLPHNLTHSGWNHFVSEFIANGILSQTCERGITVSEALRSYWHIWAKTICYENNIQTQQVPISGTWRSWKLSAFKLTGITGCSILPGKSW